MFVQRLHTTPPARSADEALDLVAKILNQIEDEHSGVEYNPDAWKNDGRMYPPKEDSRREVSGRPSFAPIPQREAHHLYRPEWVHSNPEFGWQVLLDKPGHDGRKTHDLDT